MFRYLVRRLLWAILLFIVITFVTFVIFYIAPNNPARAYCGGENAKAQCLEAATEKYHFDDPVPLQYFNFLKRLVIDRSLGQSTFTGQDVNEAIAQAAPVTASLVFGGAVLWMMIGLVVGVFSALKPRSLLDRAAMVFVLIGVSAHPVWIGLIFSYFFGYKLGITPIANYANFFGAPADSGLPGGPWQWFYHLILPWCTFAILFAALYVRMIRAERDGDPERGLRTDRACEGRAREPRPYAPRAAQRTAAGRHHAWHGHRSCARRRDLHGDRLPASRSRPDLDPRNQQQRPRGRPGRDRLRDVVHHLLQPRRRPFVCLESTRASASPRR